VTGDMRVTAAREYLDAIRPYKVSTRPLSVLQREAAELRRMLGQVLDVAEHQAPALTAAKWGTVLAALGDAAEHLRERAAWCPECEASPAALCDGCALRLSRADDYEQLAAAIGGQW